MKTSSKASLGLEGALSADAGGLEPESPKELSIRVGSRVRMNGGNVFTSIGGLRGKVWEVEPEGIT